MTASFNGIVRQLRRSGAYRSQQRAGSISKNLQLIDFNRMKL